MDSPDSRATIGWAGSALILTAVVAIGAKIAGVIIAPGSRGIAGEGMVNFVDTTSGAFAYTLTALLVALVCGASFELARARSVNVIARGSVVAASGLIVALASPAVVARLSTLPSLTLALITTVISIVAGAIVLQTAQTRAVGGVLGLLALCALLRVAAWQTSAIAVDRGSVQTLQLARGFATAAVALHAIAALLAAAWIGTRSKWRGRILANAAILLAFALTWVAARDTESPSTFEAVLRTSMQAAYGPPQPYLLASIGAFLVPASILLAAVALLQPAPPAVVTSLALALLSHGAFNVPLHALLITASAQWAMLAMTDDRAQSVSLVRRREGAPQAASGTTESA